MWCGAQPAAAQLVALCLASLARTATTGWISNSATSETDAIVVSHSDENLACANNAWKAVDGLPGFGCPAATGCAATQCPIEGWNAMPDDEWLVFDFKRTLTLSALRFSGPGDTLHDPKDMTVSAADAATGPWRAVGKFVGAAGKHGHNSFNTVWQEFGFTATSSRYWKWEISTRHGGYQAWIGEVEWYGSSDWGWAVLAVLLGGGALYVGGGLAHGYRSKGLAGTAALPHRGFWMEAAALVADGVAFSRHLLQHGNVRAAARPAAAAAGSSNGRRGKKASSQTATESLLLVDEDANIATAGPESEKERRRGGWEKKKKKNEQQKATKQRRYKAEKEGEEEAAAVGESSHAPSESNSRTAPSAGGGRWVHLPG